ncbi:MAG: hypothetical protein ACM3PT_03490 [Deltaproteobacteria bacterium]
MKILFFFIFTSLFFSSCEKNCESGEKRLDFYFLKEYKTKNQSNVIIPGSEILSNDKAISYDEILKYNPEKHIFTLTKKTIERLNGEPIIHKKAFAAVVDGEIIYTGYFWALFSSSICDWINIDYLDNGNNTVCVKLGYPTDDYGSGFSDHRNHKKILELLECDGKLSKK